MSAVQFANAGYVGEPDLNVLSSVAYHFRELAKVGANRSGREAQTPRRHRNRLPRRSSRPLLRRLTTGYDGLMAAVVALEQAGLARLPAGQYRYINATDVDARWSYFSITPDGEVRR
jgi:hypothetical protein